MNRLTASTILAAIALAVAGALGVATVAGGTFGVESLLGRAVILGSPLILVGSAVWVNAFRARRDRRQFEQHIRALCMSASQAGATPAQCVQVPPLPRSHPWVGLAELIDHALLKYRTHLDDLDHDRATLEIRCGRATAQLEKIKAIFAGLAEPILAIDDYDEVVLANASAEELFAIDGEKTESRALRRLVHCEKLIELLSATAQRKSPGGRTEELELVDSEGNTHWFRVTATKLDSRETDRCHPDLSSHGVVAVLRDIGDHKALQKRNAEFVSAVSHEMKTPLAGIKAYVELLADGDAEDEETRDEFLGVIKNQADRLQRLVENLLNIARIEAGVVCVSKVEQSLNELLEEALHVVQPSAAGKEIDLVAELSPLYLGVLADRDMLLQAAINLLSNAIKYTPVRGKVTLRSRFDDKEVCFEVQDTGVGLSTEDCQRVFDKFYRVQKEKGMAPGTGLGLPLAKHIVEDVHRGRLTVSSTEGQGSTFSVILPGAGQMTTNRRGTKVNADS